MLNLHSFFNIIYNDIAEPWQLGFQDSASPGFSGIVELHNTIFFYLVIISIFVFWLLGSIIYFYNGRRTHIVHKYLNHGTFKCLHTKIKVNINDLFNLKMSVNIKDSKNINNNYEILQSELSNYNFYRFNYINRIKIQVRNYFKSTNKFVPGELLNIANEKEKVTAVKIYDSALICKKEILEENKNKAGIYRFYNKLNGNFYIGSSKNLSNRFKSYFNLSYISRVKNNLTISRALIKYGYDNFRVEIFEYCDNSKEMILNREQYYMDLLKPTYNIEKLAVSSLGRKVSEETKFLISKSLKQRYLTQKSSRLGTKHTMETKELMSLSKKGFNNPLYGQTHSDKTKALMSRLKTGNIFSNNTKFLISKSLGDETYLYKIVKTEDQSKENDNTFTFIKIDGSLKKFILINKFNSLREVGKFLGISHSTVSRYLKSDKLFQGIYKISQTLLD